MREVIENARCELYDAVEENKRQHPWILEWAAAFDFSFVVDRDANAATDTSYLLPINAGTFTFGLKASLKQKAKGTYVVKYKMTKGLSNYEEIGCPRFAKSMPSMLLNGEIGLRQWLNTVIPEIEAARVARTDVKGSKKPGTGDVTDLSYTIEFGVTADGSLIPGWALTFPDKHQLKPAFNVTLSEAVTHKLIVGMTPKTKVDALDLTGIEVEIDGRKQILARRVCLVEDGALDKCLRLTPDTTKLVQEKKEAKKALDAAKRDMQALKDATLFKDKLKDAVPRELRKDKDPFATLLDEANRNKITNYDVLIQSVEENKVLAAEKELQIKSKKLQAAEDAVRITKTARTEAQRRAEAEAERETSRRLDLLIQQQVIRDAFRQ